MSSNISSNNKRIAKNTIALYFRTFIIMIVSLYTSRVVLQVLGETDYGVYNIVGGVVVLFSFLNQAMATATQRFLNYALGQNDENETHRVFSMSMTVHIAIAIIVVLLAETVGLWFVNTSLNIPQERMVAAFWVYQFSVVACCLQIIRVPYHATIIAYERMSFFAYVSIFEVVLKLLICYLLLVSSFDSLILYAILMAVVLFIVNFVYKVYCNHHFPTSKYSFFYENNLFKKLLRFTGWTMLGGIANVGVNQGLNILLNLFYGVALNAAIGLAHQIQAAIMSFVASFQTAFSPQIVKLWSAHKKEECFNLVCRSSRLSYCLVFVISVPVLVCINPILHLWLTEVPKYTADFVTIFVIYSVIDAVSGPLWISVQATGDIKRYQIIMSIIILANLPIMYALFYWKVSPVIVVMVRAILNFVLHCARVEYLRKFVSFPAMEYFKSVMFPITLMTLLCLPLSIFLINKVESILSTVLIFSAILLQNIVLVILLGINKGERQMAKNFIINKIKK